MPNPGKGIAVTVASGAIPFIAPAAVRHAQAPVHKALAQPKAAPAKHPAAAKPKPASGEEGNWKEF
jgi:hypothetical protein